MTSKTILVLAITTAFVAGTITSGTFAEAQKVPNGQPFQAIWDAIANLQTQIDTIELTPGPQGEQGIPGIQGEQGSPGQDADTTGLQNQIDMLDQRISALEDGNGEPPGMDCTLRGSGVDLSGCDLNGADLNGANLSFADLSNASIAVANLENANLRNADLSGVNFFGSNLSSTDLTGANLENASFAATNLQDAIGAPFVGCLSHPSCV